MNNKIRIMHRRSYGSRDSVEKNLSPHYARDHMADKRIRHLAVTDAGTIVGMISARDLLAYFKTVSQEAV